MFDCIHVQYHLIFYVIYIVILVFQALSQAKALQKEVDLLQGSPYLHGLRRVSELKTLSLPTLKSLQAQLRSDLEAVEKVLL